MVRRKPRTGGDAGGLKPEHQVAVVLKSSSDAQQRLRKAFDLVLRAVARTNADAEGKEKPTSADGGPEKEATGNGTGASEESF